MDDKYLNPLDFSLLCHQDLPPNIENLAVKMDSSKYVERPSTQIPSGSWDSHMHVVDPKRYPLAAEARYIPSTHSLEDALLRESELGISNIVLVQPSIYGNNNSCLIDALRRLGSNRGRGVVVFDPLTIDRKTLESWHGLGVRGVRVNFQSVNKEVNSSAMAELLCQYADIIRPFDWVLQLYTPLSTIETLENIIGRLDVKVCLDHFGCPSMWETGPSDPELLAGFSSLVRLLQQGNTYVKISAHYRLCEDVGQLEPMARTLMRPRNGQRVVFGTDWPHTRFAGLEIAPFVQTVLEWCDGDKVLEDRVFRDNARELWDTA